MAACLLVVVAISISLGDVVVVGHHVVVVVTCAVACSGNTGGGCCAVGLMLLSVGRRKMEGRK